MLESNTDLPIVMSNSTIRDSKLFFENIDEVNELFVATLEGELEGRSYFRIKKTSEVEYPTSYSNQTDNEVLVGVW